MHTESAKLSFCKINKLDIDLAEIIANDGVEINMDMLKECHQWISGNLENPCGLLVNKINQYTYTFEVQIKLMDLSNIKACAVITYSNISELATKTMTRLPRKIQWNIGMFKDRENALEWLKNEMSK